jgi:hypothetical protein
MPSPAEPAKNQGLRLLDAKARDVGVIHQDLPAESGDLICLDVVHQEIVVIESCSGDGRLLF